MCLAALGNPFPQDRKHSLIHILCLGSGETLGQWQPFVTQGWSSRIICVCEGARTCLLLCCGEVLDLYAILAPSLNVIILLPKARHGLFMCFPVLCLLLAAPVINLGVCLIHLPPGTARYNRLTWPITSVSTQLLRNPVHRHPVNLHLSMCSPL